MNINVHIIDATAYDGEGDDDTSCCAAIVSAGKGFSFALPGGHGVRRGGVPGRLFVMVSILQIGKTYDQTQPTMLSLTHRFAKQMSQQQSPRPTHCKLL